MNSSTVHHEGNISSQPADQDGSPVTGLSSALIVIIACMLSVYGCLGMYGTLKSDPGVTRMFITGNALPDYRYFYSGRADAPMAVIGIAPEYSLKSRFWHPIGTKAEVVAKVARTGCSLRDNPRGFRILDASGDQAGLWFSNVHHTVIQSGENNEINVYAPDLEGLRGNHRHDDPRLLFWNRL